ncbi:signal peptide peptidase SppA [Streptococcus moroccensis]|uniref:Protease-4 n=1 Tax=Streptococcus moroccensis TaxID=1451356 RepID=A0ABT9YRV3_9STRE|nr:signal peptide peptidase SppA [Streptococcus moroccensis]MDQ0222729.1 protease-4 [Streptococcus moroccensis]
MDKKKGIVIGLAAVVLLTSLFSSSPKKAEVDETTSTTSLNKLFGLSNSLTEEVLEEGDALNRILVIPINGSIGTEDGQYFHDHILSSIDNIKEDSSIKAVLLTIDSPGGGVYATREVYDRMKEVQSEVDIPIYASMGSTAASGGYYLAMLGEKVFASSETLTGSIGVIMSSYNTEGLLEKLGVKPQVIKSADMKDIMSSSREMTEEERQVLQSYVDESFQRFVDVVEEGRGMSEDEVRKLADGRIYSGSQAQAVGLIDAIGYQKDALQALRDDFDLADAQVFTYTTPDLGFGSLFPSFLGQLGLNSEETPASQLNQVIEKIESLDDMTLEYRMQGGF